MMKKLLLAFMVSAVVFLGLGGFVLANNHSDTSWGGILPRFQGNFYTGAREKQDATSAYIKLNYCGKGGVRSWVQMSDGTEVDSPKVNVLVGQSRKPSNYAYERYARYGKVYVRLAIESNYVNPVTIEAGGVWSPDSV